MEVTEEVYQNIPNNKDNCIYVQQMQLCIQMPS